jgi:hypothetical protein
MNDRAWHRRHQNGQVALVFERDGKFSAGAAPENGSRSIRYDAAQTLDAAQRYADRESGCPQPCQCPPWSE